MHLAKHYYSDQNQVYLHDNTCTIEVWVIGASNSRFTLQVLQVLPVNEVYESTATLIKGLGHHFQIVTIFLNEGSHSKTNSFLLLLKSWPLLCLAVNGNASIV